MLGDRVSGPDVLPDPPYDVLRAGARREELPDPLLLQLADVIGRNDASPEDGDILRAPLPQEFEHTWEDWDAVIDVLNQMRRSLSNGHDYDRYGHGHDWSGDDRDRDRRYDDDRR